MNRSILSGIRFLLLFGFVFFPSRRLRADVECCVGGSSGSSAGSSGPASCVLARPYDWDVDIKDSCGEAREWSGSRVEKYSDNATITYPLGNPLPNPNKPVKSPPTGPGDKAYLVSVILTAAYSDPVFGTPRCILSAESCPKKLLSDKYGSASIEFPDLPPCRTGGRGCPNCGNACATNGSVFISFNVGLPLMAASGAGTDGSATYLRLLRSVLDDDTFSPGALEFRDQDGFVVVRANGQIQQITSRSATTTVAPLDGSLGFTVSFQLPSAATPFVTWKVHDPGAPSGERRLQLTQFTGATEVSHVTYVFHQGTGEWELIEGANERIVTQTTGVEPGPNGTTYTVTTRSVTDGEGNLAARTVSKAIGERIYQEIEGFGVETLTRSYAYDADGRLLLTQWSQSGVVQYWERILYANDHGTLRKQVVRPEGDLPLPANPLDSINDDYYLDNGHVFEITTEASEERRPLAGQPVVVSTTTTLRSAEVSPINANWLLNVVETVAYTGTGQSLRRVDKTHPDDVPAPYGGRLYAHCEPDGTARTYSYETGTWDTTDGSFQPEVNGSCIRTTIIEKVPQGGGEAVPMANVTHAYVSVRNPAGAELLNEEQLCTGVGNPGAFVSLTRVISAYDATGNLTKKSKNGREIFTAFWSNGRILWETDETGVKTTYSNWDSSGRPRQSVREAIPEATGLPGIPALKIEYVFDALGRTISETRTSMGAETQSVITQGRQYDTTGRIKEQTNDGVRTTYAYELGGLRTVKILPGGMTEVTERYLDGRVKSIFGTALIAQSYSYVVADASGLQTELSTRGSEAVQLSSATTRDWVGRVIEERRPGSDGEITRSYTYDDAGRLATEISTGLEPRTYSYSYGPGVSGHSGFNQTITQELIANGVRTSQITTYYEAIDTTWYQVRANTHGAIKKKLVGFGANEVAATIVVDALGNNTVSVTTLDTGTKSLTRTVSRSGLQSVTISRLGMMQSMTSPSVNAATVFGYDAHGRQLSMKDPRTGSSTITTYDPVCGQPATSEGPGQSVSQTYYSATDRRAGRLAARTINGQTTRYDYDEHGRLSHQWGAGSYPQRYEFDGNGRLYKVHTYRDIGQWSGTVWPGGAEEGNITTWSYYAGTEQVAAKTDALGKATSYTYWPSGLLRKRTWARAGEVTTSYTYNGAGELTLINYSDTTPAVHLSYDAEGRVDSVIDAAGTHTFAYNDLGRLDREQITGGILAGWVLDPSYAGDGRLSGLTGSFNGNRVIDHSFTSEAGTGRLGTVIDALTPGGALSVEYHYLTNSDLLATTTSTQGGSELLNVTRTWDDANRLKKLTTTRGATTVASYEWTYDTMGRRTQAILADNSFWDYGYNQRNEVVSGTKKVEGGTPLGGYSFGYDFDAIGNRLSTTTNGRAASYTANSVNQYSSRQVPGYVDILATTADEVSTSVTVSGPQGDIAATKQGRAYHASVPIDNAGGPQFPVLNVRGVKGGGIDGTDYEESAAGKFFLPQTPESFVYDEDGNLKQDGRWNYTWDAESRLVEMETRSLAVAAGVPRQKLEFMYDFRGRRIRKMVSGNWSGATYSSKFESRFLYDEGWNLLAEIDASGTLIRRFLWGADLSGSRQAAGGVGGLLIASTAAGAQLPFYDGNGNVVGYLDAATGNKTAQYEYGPFGEALKATGPAAQSLPFRYSTKYAETETELVYYGLRYYKPNVGRWLNRDPKGEQGGLNLYTFIGNSSIQSVDALGMETLGGALLEKFKHDIHGWILVQHYLYGDGSALVLDWGDYMEASPGLRVAVALELSYLANKGNLCDLAASHGAERETRRINITTHVDVGEGERAVGYDLLGGSNSRVGDFQIVGSVTYFEEDCCCTMEFDLDYTFNDVMNFNVGQYLTDVVWKAVSETVTLGFAGPYDLKIQWSDTSVVKRCRGKKEERNGWPFSSNR
jgi:RHS repeat-associated protein